MSEPVGLFVLGLLVLAAGAGALAVGAARLAARACGPFAVGLVAVGLGPCVAPLALALALVSRTAAPDDISRLQVMALGTLVGAGALGVLLVLGAAAVARPVAVSARLFGTAIPAAIGAAGLFWFLGRDNHLSRADGGALLVAFAVAVGALVRAARQEPAPGRAGFEGAVPARLPAWAAVLLVLGGLGATAGGAELAADRAAEARRALALTGAALGLTLAALGATLPALIGAVPAARAGRGDVALGLAVGPLACGLLLGGGVVALVQPLPVPEAVIMKDVPAAALCALLLLIPLANGSVRRWEGALFLAAGGGLAAWQLARVLPGR